MNGAIYRIGCVAFLFFQIYRLQYHLKHCLYNFSLFIILGTFSTLKRILIRPDFTTSRSTQSSKPLIITFRNCFFLSFTWIFNSPKLPPLTVVAYNEFSCTGNINFFPGICTLRPIRFAFKSWTLSAWKFSFSQTHLLLNFSTYSTEIHHESSKPLTIIFRNCFLSFTWIFNSPKLPPLTVFA